MRLVEAVGVAPQSPLIPAKCWGAPSCFALFLLGGCKRGRHPQSLSPPRGPGTPSCAVCGSQVPGWGCVLEGGSALLRGMGQGEHQSPGWRGTCSLPSSEHWPSSESSPHWSPWLLPHASGRSWSRCGPSGAPGWGGRRQASPGRRDNGPWPSWVSGLRLAIISPCPQCPSGGCWKLRCYYHP